MTRLPRSRVAVATGLTVGVAVAVLAVGTTASAAPRDAPVAAPTAPSTVAAGTPFTVTGAGCPTAAGTDPAYAVVLTDEAVSTGDVAVGDSGPDGSWSVTLTFPAGTSAGTHEIGAVCRSGDGGEPTEFDYPIVSVTVG
jgi:hypothetical protein